MAADKNICEDTLAYTNTSLILVEPQPSRTQPDQSYVQSM